jgi:hypothetical protein
MVPDPQHIEMGGKLFARTERTSIKPYCKGSGAWTVPSFNEPEKGIDRVVLLYGREGIRRDSDVTGVLLLAAEDGRARSWVGSLVGNGDRRGYRRLQGGGDKASERQIEEH